MAIHPRDQLHRLAQHDDLQRILGDLDDSRVIAVLELKPTVLDLEEASACLAGDEDRLAGRGHHVSPVANRVVEIIVSAEEEEPPPKTV